MHTKKKNFKFNSFKYLINNNLKCKLINIFHEEIFLKHKTTADFI